jgi:hypothetical protein
MFSMLLRFELGRNYEALFRYGPPVGYIIATLIWLHAFVYRPTIGLTPQMALERPPAEDQRSPHAHGK